jgi:AraC-like DNA-binding protein
MELNFYLGNRPEVLDNSRHLESNTLLSGQQSGFYDLLVTGNLSMFSVTFEPYGASMFFEIPSNEFSNLNVPLKYFVKDSVDELESRLQEAGSFEVRIGVVECFLLKQLRKSFKEYETRRVIQSISLINDSKGMISIEMLSSSACLSRKQYERTFLGHIGCPPGQFLRTLRFQYSLQVKKNRKDISLTELAYDCGYYDQSHMINDFRKLSGKTPTQYFAECEPYSDYFL